jgi:hypothetical protein
MKTFWKPALAAVLVLLFMYFIYPTRYMYLPTTTAISPEQTGPQGQFPVRINRFTGQTEILFGTLGWVYTAR